MWGKLFDFLAGLLAKPKGANRGSITIVRSFGIQEAPVPERPPVAVLRRHDDTDEGTFGTLTIMGQTFRTLELPWRNNQTGISCIPPGTYQAHKRFSPRFQTELYRLSSVPGREGILFHAANFAGDTTKGLKCELNGCIALGESVGVLAGQRALINSRKAMDRFHALLAGEPFDLEIRA